jgi:uncharacterized protein YkwD
MIRIRLLSTFAALAVAAGLLATSAPAPASASDVTAGDVASMLLADINAGRKAHGLVVYRSWDRLAALARERAQAMADARTLSHAAAGGDVGTALDARGVDWYGYGETIGMTGWPWGQEAADSIYSMWKASDAHRAILFSGDDNYIGIGVAQAADGSTWVSAVMTESKDHTAPTARTRSLTRIGRTLSFTWAGADRRLQTHTAGPTTASGGRSATTPPRPGSSSGIGCAATATPSVSSRPTGGVPFPRGPPR